MPHISDLLHRFRPIGAPGSASRAGVPADRVAELAAELEPVLEILAATEERSAAVVAEAEQRAVVIGTGARTQAAVIAADGRDRAAAARVAAAERVIAAAHTEADRIERSAAQAVHSRPELGEAEVRTLTEQAARIIQAVAEG